MLLSTEYKNILLSTEVHVLLFPEDKIILLRFTELHVLLSTEDDIIMLLSTEVDVLYAIY